MIELLLKIVALFFRDFTYVNFIYLVKILLNTLEKQ